MGGRDGRDFGMGVSTKMIARLKRGWFASEKIKDVGWDMQQNAEFDLWGVVGMMNGGPQ
jgi:hypothetical protein